MTLDELPRIYRLEPHSIFVGAPGTVRSFALDVSSMPLRILDANSIRIAPARTNHPLNLADIPVFHEAPSADPMELD